MHVTKDLPREDFATLAAQAIESNILGLQRAPTGRAIIRLLANTADANANRITLSKSTIAKVCDCKEPSVKSWLLKLERAGIVPRSRKSSGGRADATSERAFCVATLRQLIAASSPAGAPSGNVIPLRTSRAGDAGPGSPVPGSPISGFAIAGYATAIPGYSVAVPGYSVTPKGREGEGSFLSETYHQEPSPSIPYSPLPPSSAPQAAGTRWGSAIDELRAEGKAQHVVEHLIAPLAATKAPGPRISDPRQELRDIRDALVEFEASTLKLARQRLAAEWVRDFPHLKACVEACEKARVDAMVQLPAGSPGWAAWVAYCLADPEKSAWARSVSAKRWSMAQETEFPPASAEIEPPSGPVALWSITARTPEWHAWLAHYRRNGRTALAQSHEVAGNSLQTESRWPPAAERGPA